MVAKRKCSIQQQEHAKWAGMGCVVSVLEVHTARMVYCLEVQQYSILILLGNFCLIRFKCALCYVSSYFAPVLSVSVKSVLVIT